MCLHCVSSATNIRSSSHNLCISTIALSAMAPKANVDAKVAAMRAASAAKSSFDAAMIRLLQRIGEYLQDVAKEIERSIEDIDRGEADQITLGPFELHASGLYTQILTCWPKDRWLD